MTDQASPGFVISLISNAPVLREESRTDPNTLGQILENLTDVTDRIESFVFEDSEKELDVLKLRVDNSDLYFFENPGWVKGNFVRFFFGYPGKIFGPRVHVIDSVKGFTSLTITCIEQAAQANSAKNRLFENMTRSAVVQQMVTEGLFPGVSILSLSTEGRQRLASETARDWQQTRQSDWQFVQSLAEDVGFEVWIENAALFFQPSNYGQRPIRRYEYLYGLGELISLNIDEWATTDRPAQSDVGGRDPVERENLSSTGSDSTTQRSTLGGQSTLQIGSTGNLEVQQANPSALAGRTIDPSPETDQATVTQQADTRFRRYEEQEVMATAAIIGDPELPAKSVIEIVGIGPTLSGKFFVTKATHRIDRGTGYRCNLKLKKNALTNVPSSEPPTTDSTLAAENDQSLPANPRALVLAPDSNGDLGMRRQ